MWWQKTERFPRTGAELLVRRQKARKKAQAHGADPDVPTPEDREVEAVEAQMIAYNRRFAAWARRIDGSDPGSQR